MEVQNNAFLKFFCFVSQIVTFWGSPTLVANEVKNFSNEFVWGLPVKTSPS